MKINIRERDVVVTEVLRDHVQRRLGLALGRFGEKIGRVAVQFSGGDVRPGGAEKRCRIDVALRPQDVRVEDADVDLFAAVDRATERVARSVARTLDRERAQ